MINVGRLLVEMEYYELSVGTLRIQLDASEERAQDTRPKTKFGSFLSFRFQNGIERQTIGV